jgi:secondary thiamine-phosphate synthase enzyme
LKIVNETLHLETRGFCHVIDVTEAVAAALAQTGMANGQALIFVVGATGGITTVEYEPGLVKDLEELFDKLAPPTLDYHHEETWRDGNGFSHVRASLLKPSLTVPIQDGRLRLGVWQQIVVIDFDNKSRQRKVALQFLGE